MPYTCSQCGAQNPDTAQFCYNCGASAPAAGSPSPINLGKPGDANPYQSPSYPQPPSNPYGAPSQPSPYDQQAMAPQSNPYGAPPAYGQTFGSAGGFGSPEATAAQNKAKNAMILSIVGFLCCPLCSIVGLIFGFSSRSELQRMNVQDGQGQALAAIIISALSIVFTVLWIIIQIIAGLASH
jgi:hypothetical protein